MRLSGVASSALTLFGLAQAIDHIPYPCHGTYQVVEGDTCQSIAALAGTDASTLQLWQQNFKENFDCADITLGQVLCVDYSASITKRDHVIEPVRGGNTHIDTVKEPVRGGSTHIDVIATK